MTMQDVLENQYPRLVKDKNGNYIVAVVDGAIPRGIIGNICFSIRKMYIVKAYYKTVPDGWAISVSLRSDLSVKLKRKNLTTINGFIWGYIYYAKFTGMYVSNRK